MRASDTPSTKGRDAAWPRPDHGHGQHGRSATGDFNDRLRRERVRERFFGKKPETIEIAGRFALVGLVAIELACASVRGHLVRAGTTATRADVRLLPESGMLAKRAHPNVVQVCDAGVYEDWVIIAKSAELIERRLLCLGEGLRATLKQWARADASIVEHVVDAAEALLLMAWCHDMHRLAHGIAPPMPQLAFLPIRVSLGAAS